MTEGGFLLALAVLAKKYRGGKAVLKVVISKHANECGLEIDEDGPHSEQMVIVEPLKVFLDGVSSDIDLLYQSASARLAWEAYQNYLEQKHTRIRAAVLANQHDRRYGSK